MSVVGVVANVLVGLVALEHVYFAILEMILWTKPRGMKTFGMTAEYAAQTATLAKNQGLYNLFLAAGLGWSLADGGRPLKYFFLGCVFVAGIFGGITVNKRIALVQAFPAALSIVVVMLSS
jgi:putative membrane protein